MKFLRILEPFSIVNLQDTYHRAIDKQMERRPHVFDAEPIIWSLGALAAGLAVGLLYGSAGGRKARARMANRTVRGVRWFDRHVDDVSARILAVGDEAADHLRTAVREAIEKALLEFGTEEEWQQVYAEAGSDIHHSKL